MASAAEVDAGLVMHYFGSKQELYRRVIDAAPVPEIGGTPAEAAGAVYLFCSPDSDYVSGQTLLVTGGL